MTRVSEQRHPQVHITPTIQHHPPYHYYQHTHHHINLTMTKRNKSIQQSNKTIIEHQIQHQHPFRILVKDTKHQKLRTKITRTTIRTQRKATYQKIPRVVRHELFTKTSVPHQKQHFHTLQVSSKPKPERTAPDACTPLLTLQS